MISANLPSVVVDRTTKSKKNEVENITVCLVPVELKRSHYFILNTECPKMTDEIVIILQEILFYTHCTRKTF